MLKAKIGKWEIELRTDPKELAEKLNINLEVAVKLATLEVASDNQYGENKSEFKNWKNKRIYFTNLVDSKRANGQQRYWDLEENELVDNGLSFFDQKQMKELLELVTVETFYKEEETVEEVKDEETTIKKLREATNMNLKEFSEYLNIPYRTLQNWEMAEDTPNKRKPPAYVVNLIKYKIENERMIKMLDFGEFKLRDVEEYEMFYIATDTLHILVTNDFYELKNYRQIGPAGKIKVYHDGLYFGTPEEMNKWLEEEIIEYLKENNHLVKDGETKYGEDLWKLA